MAKDSALLDRLVEWARKDSIYIIIDLHCAPGGQTGTNIDDSYGYPSLYLSPDAQKQTVDIWRRIASHYSREPIVLGYDLLNEPIPHFPELRRFDPDLENAVPHNCRRDPRSGPQSRPDPGRSAVGQ